MNDSIQRLIDRQEALAGSYISRTAAMVRPVGDRLIACDHPNAVRVGYRLAHNRADTVPADRWSEFPADKRAGRWPISYRRVGTVLGSAVLLDAIREREPSLHRAVGWTYKNSILVGVLPDEMELPEDSHGNYEIGMRVGNGVLRTAFGVYDSLHREFTVPQGISAMGPSYEEVLEAPHTLVVL